MNIITLTPFVAAPGYEGDPPYEILAQNIAYVTEQVDYEFMKQRCFSGENLYRLIPTVVLIGSEKLYVNESVDIIKRRLRCME